MKMEGILHKCERCGCERFLKRLKDKEMDGGFTITEQYEELEKGWTDDVTKIAGKFATYELCPDCSAAYDVMMEKFMGECK